MADNKSIVGFPDNDYLDTKDDELYKFIDRYLKPRDFEISVENRKLLRENIRAYQGQMKRKISHLETRMYLDAKYESNLIKKGFIDFEYKKVLIKAGFLK